MAVVHRLVFDRSDHAALPPFEHIILNRNEVLDVVIEDRNSPGKMIVLSEKIAEQAAHADFVVRGFFRLQIGIIDDLNILTIVCAVEVHFIEHWRTVTGMYGPPDQQRFIGRHLQRDARRYFGVGKRRETGIRFALEVVEAYDGYHGEKAVDLIFVLNEEAAVKTVSVRTS